MIAGAQGICFAVASNTASYVVSEIIRHGRVRRAYIGIAAVTIPLPRRIGAALGLTQSQGVAISDVTAGSPAAQSGLKGGEIVVALDEATVTGADDLLRLLSGERIGKRISLSVVADGELRKVEVTPVERDER